MFILTTCLTEISLKLWLEGQFVTPTPANVNLIMKLYLTTLDFCERPQFSLSSEATFCYLTLCLLLAICLETMQGIQHQDSFINVGVETPIFF